MPLGMEVGLELGDFVLDGDPAPSRTCNTLRAVVCLRTAPRIELSVAWVIAAA